MGYNFPMSLAVQAAGMLLMSLHTGEGERGRSGREAKRLFVQLMLDSLSPFQIPPPSRVLTELFSIFQSSAAYSI